MAKRTRTTIDKAKLYSLIKQGKSAQEIMKALGIKQRSQLKSAIFDLIVEKGEVLIVPGMSGRATGRSRKVNKMGIQIPASLLKGYYEVGAELEIEISKDKIVLKKV